MKKNLDLVFGPPNTRTLRQELRSLVKDLDHAGPLDRTHGRFYAIPEPDPPNVKRWTYDRQVNPPQKAFRGGDSASDFTEQTTTSIQGNFFQCCFEIGSVFYSLNRLRPSADHLNAIFLKITMVIREPWQDLMLFDLGVLGLPASGHTSAITFSNICQVSGSIWVRSAVSASVMIVAGFELTRTTRYHHLLGLTGVRA